MDDFANILQRDFGLRPQGKDAPMTSSKQAAPFSSSSPSSTPASIHRTSSGGRSKNGSNRTSRSSTPILGESLQDDLFFASSNGFNSTPSVQNTHGSAASDMPDMYDDVFGGPPKFSSTSFPTMPSSRGQQASASQSYDDIFRMPAKPAAATTFSSNKGSAFPVFDAPLYDDDIFGGVPGIRSTSVVYDDVFSGGSTVGTSPSVLEDLLGVSQSKESRDNSSSLRPSNLDSERPSAGVSDFDELLPGFGGGEPTKNRSTRDGKPAEDRSSTVEQNSHGMSPSDPFDVLQVDDSFKVPESSPQAWAPLAPEPDASKISVQPPSGAYGSKRYSSNDHEEKFATSGETSPHVSPSQSPSMSDSTPETAMHADVLDEKHSKINQNSNDDQTRSTSSPIPPQRDHMKASSFHSPRRRTQPVYNDVEELVRATKNRPVDEFWITVEDVKLVTQPTAVPPPSRRPPLPGFKQSKKAAPSFKNSASRHESPKSAKVSSSTGASEQLKRSNLNNLGSTYDDVEEFAQGVSRARKENKMDMSTKTLEDEVIEGTAAVSASSMAMREAAERARAKLRERVKEEKESPGLGESQGNLDESGTVEEGAREGEEKDRLREREERDREARAIRERDDRERRRREKEERDKERLKDRIAVERAAVERATAEARERAAADARQRAAVERAVAEARERAAAEAREKAAAEARQRVAVERATAEARERAAAESRERAAAEARERAAAEARDRAAAEKAAAERAAVERATSEARARAERAVVERALAEARERAAEKAAAEARERAAAEAKEKAAAAERASATREQQRRNENDLEAFFASNSRPGSAPRQRSPAQGAASDNRQSSRGFSSTDGPQRSSMAAPAARKVTPATATDDWTSLFGPSVSASDEFHEVEGENAERRRARLERHQRTAERAARALSEKNQRDLQSQRDQEERHRAGEILDTEIKRWAAGKEGNLRALLSTLQYVLWPECGWQAVSLTDLITAAAVKKVYRKATLCVHPDKVQQKGATIQQKYVAEKVFDLLKEAWNKFNSEELF